MMEEFRRYCALQRDQAPLAWLLIYLKRKGGFVQLNQIWKDLGPSSGGPFWNQTTLMNKLDKLERLEVISLERRVIPSSRSEDKKKTNTFYRLSPASPLAPHIFCMLNIRSDDEESFSSDLSEKPLDRLNDMVSRSSRGAHSTKRELQVALELISEVFGIDDDDVREMIRQRMIRRGLIKVSAVEDSKGSDREGDGKEDARKKSAREERARKDGAKKTNDENTNANDENTDTKSTKDGKPPKGRKGGTRRRRSKTSRREDAQAGAA